ncbi:conserved hypothetical protein [Coccidioides posadasii str. Silveira]|uniref:Uncharacterized protein n=1 Tax=Coccidioides posadasii (strain RMSCC 757 / Silveira) TaxID=443226 RepID=E9D6Q8_COCPS|nr:conserved hypothetical protein [Coccidioides posadasii str. Silveira]
MSSRSEGAMEVGMHGSVVTEVLEDQHPSGLEASPMLRRKGERQKIQSSYFSLAHEGIKEDPSLSSN